MRISPRLFVAAVLGVAAPLVAQEKASDTLLTVNHYLDFETVSDAKISPDGSRIIYTRRFVDKQKDSFESAMWIMNADGSQNRFLARGAAPVWSPDGSRIAYLAEGAPGGAQVFVRWMNAEGATSQVTRTEYGPADIAWSPDGKWIGFAMYTPKPNVVSRCLFAVPRMGELVLLGEMSEMPFVHAFDAG